MSSDLQSLRFDRAKFTPAQACDWAKEHSYPYASFDTPHSDRYHHMMLRPPWRFEGPSLRTEPIGDGVSATRGELHGRHPNPKGPSHRVPNTTIILATALDIVVEDEEMRYTLDFTPGAVLLLAPADAMERAPSGGRLYLVRDRRANERHITSNEADAGAAYETWTDGRHEAETVAELEVPDRFTEPVGRALTIAYRSDKFSQRGKHVDYEHSFNEPGPLVYYSDHPVEGYALVGGAFTVTQAGIED